MKKLMLLMVLAACAAVVAAPKAKKGPARRAPQKQAVAGLKVKSDVRRAPYQGAISVDAASGKVIFEDRADAKCCPASVTKLMTLLLVLEDMHALKYSTVDEVTATVRCTREKPSVCGLKPGMKITVDELLFVMLVHSANDAAVLLAENSTARNAGREIQGGDLQAFVQRMNEKAKELGMTSTSFVTPNGFPPPYGSGKPYDTSTARDLVKLARALVKYNEIYRWTSAKTYTMKTIVNKQGQPVKFLNHNNILRMDKKKIVNAQGESEVDGLKTGYAEYCGSSIILTGKRDGHRAIVVVVGSETSKMRDEHARRLMVSALDAVSR